MKLAYSEMSLADDRERAELSALRALSHVGAISVDPQSAPAGFRILQAHGDMRARRPANGRALCSLTDAGTARAASKLKPGFWPLRRKEP